MYRASANTAKIAALTDGFLPCRRTSEQNEQEHRGQQRRALTDALPGRRRVQPPLARVGPRLLLALVGRRRTPGPPPRLDRCPAAVPRCLVRRLRFVWAIVRLELSGRGRRCATAEPARCTPARRRAVDMPRRLRGTFVAGMPVRRASSRRRGPDRARRPRRSASAARRRGARPRRRPRPAARVGGPRRWSRPAPRRAASSHSPIARTPGRPSGPPSRIARRDRPCALDVAGGAQLDVERDQRRACGHQHGAGASGEACAARSPGGARPRRSARPASAGPPRAQLGPRAPAGELAVQEHRQAELVAQQVAEHERLGAGRAAIAPWSRYTIGATSIAPTRGWTPSWRSMSIRRDRLRARRSAPRGPSSPGAPASVNTLRWWSGSEWMSSSRARRTRAPIAAIASRVASLRDVGDGEQQWRHSVEHVAAGVEHRARRRRRASASSDDHVEVDRDRHRAADRRRSRRTRRGPCRGSSRPRARCRSARARSLVPTPSSARFVPRLAVGAQQLDELRAQSAVGRDDRGPPLDASARRLVAEPERREARRHDRALAADRRDEALAAGQVAERARRGRARRRRGSPRGRRGPASGRCRAGT